jgi:hypothetical protein
MCDYSLSVNESRFAEEGERLVVHRFSNGVRGFASPADLCPTKREEIGFWRKVANFLSGKADGCAVCVQPGTKLMLRDLPVSLCSKLKLESDEEVTVTHAESSGVHRDGVLFRDGTEFLIQWLPEGLEADVLSVVPISVVEHAEAVRASEG